MGVSDVSDVSGISGLFDSALAEHRRIFDRIASLGSAIDRAAAIGAACLSAGGKLLFCGNGGSAADAQHLAAELVGRFVRDRRALAAIALSTDSSAVTCIANDFGYPEVFARQVEGLARPGDVLVAISTSGHSPNVVRAVEAARACRVQTIGFLGRDGGKLGAMVDLPLIVESGETARIQEAHIFLGHVLCGLIEQRLGIGGWDR
jgi:D-sedoheptulose 7-phosphate isomerase